jgi:hypothetical protein
MKKNFKKLVLYYLVVFVLFFVIINVFFSNKYSDIEEYNKLSLYVNKAEIDRGYYVLNDHYIIYCDYILTNNHELAVDFAIWRPKDSKFKPTICNLPAPFELIYHNKSDTLILLKDNIKLKLVKEKK